MAQAAAPAYGSAGLGREVAAELRHTLRPPFEVLQLVAINTVLLLLGWFLLGPTAVSNFNSAIFLPMAIASWAFADIPATNLLGVDPQESLRLLDDPKGLKRMFTVRNLTLMILICPFCILLSLFLLPSQNHPLTSAAVMLAVVAMPLAYLGVASMAAPLFPFHSMSLKERRGRKDTWVRWGLCCITPWVIIAPAGVISMIPVIIIYNLAPHRDGVYLLAALASLAWSLLLWRAGLAITMKIVRRRRAYLSEFLADPSRG